MPTKRKVVNGTLQEVPQIEKPDADQYENAKAYFADCAAYAAELKRCAATAIPMSEELKALYKEGDEVPEDVYALKRTANGVIAYPLIYPTVPVPVPPGAQGSEDELAYAYHEWAKAYEAKWKHPPTPHAIVKYFQDVLNSHNHE